MILILVQAQVEFHAFFSTTAASSFRALGYSTTAGKFVSDSVYVTDSTSI